MNLCECKNKCECALTAIIASVVIGIVAVFLNFSAIITVTPMLLWIFFAVAILMLTVGLLTAREIRRQENQQCYCSGLTAFLAGILLTVLVSVVLLVVDIAATGLLSSILVGILAGSFALMLTSAVCIIKALFGCADK